MKSQCVLAIDIGGTKISGAIVDSDFRIIHELTVPSRDSIAGIADPNLQRTKNLIRVLCDFASNHDISLLRGCAGFPEYVNLHGELTTRDNIDWTLQPQIDFETQTGFRWLAQSDVRCAGVAEALLGAGRDSDDFVYLTISSGISHTHFLHGHAVTGPNGEAIGFGLIEVGVGRERVVLENYSSGLGISRRYAQNTQDFSNDAKALLEKFDSDLEAQEVIDSATRLLGEQMAVLARDLSTEHLVIGGGLWLGSDRYRKLTIAAFDRASQHLGIHVNVVNGKVKNSGVVGAAIYAFEAERSAKI